MTATAAGIQYHTGRLLWPRFRGDDEEGTPHPCSPSLSAAIQVRQWSCGIGMWVAPRNLKASLTALAKHGTPPTFGLSPTPLAPIGWCGDGVVVQSVSHFGVSTAVGMK